MDKFHTPVLLKEVTELLQIKKGKKYIDATLGGGGHTRKILELGGEVLAIDTDSDAIENAQALFKEFEGKLTLHKGNFKDLKEIALLKNFERIDGVLFDFGVSSHQINTPSRGFSFANKGPLDMRMDQDLTVRASDLVNALSKGELYEIFYRLGDESRARAVSDCIVESRKIKPIETTEELLEIVKKAYGIKKEEISDFTKADIGKKVFQALRITVNSELENIEEALPQTIDLLKDKGRILAISFHSLEDRIVKQKFIEFEKQKMGRIITKKPIVPSLEEMRLNPRSKSAKLRIFEKN